MDAELSSDGSGVRGWAPILGWRVVRGWGANRGLTWALAYVRNLGVIPDSHSTEKESSRYNSHAENSDGFSALSDVDEDDDMADITLEKSTSQFGAYKFAAVLPLKKGSSSGNEGISATSVQQPERTVGGTSDGSTGMVLAELPNHEGSVEDTSTSAYSHIPRAIQNTHYATMLAALCR